MFIGIKCHIKHEFLFRSSVYCFKVILLIKKIYLLTWRTRSQLQCMEYFSCDLWALVPDQELGLTQGPGIGSTKS